MSSPVEDEIVTMKFDNTQFEKGVSTTLGSLGKLKESLKFEGADKGLANVQNAAGRFSLGRVSTSVDGAKKSFLALTTVGVAALATLTAKAVDAGIKIARGLLSPIKAGFDNYETKINAIQTILSNTKVAGTNLKDVTSALDELNTYANKTIYNFANMAQNIGTFTAAGVDLQTSVNSIKGIANLAALSGSSAEKASGAMYQLSQAIAAGKVNAQDWNSVVNAGMAGPTLQRALAQTAVAMGQLDSNALKLKGKMKNVIVDGESFKQSISAKPGQTSWLTSKVLTATLSQFSGDLTKAQLKAEGFNKQQIKAIQLTGKQAQNAATKIKTFSQLQQALKEEVASSWASVWEQIFGNINQARALFSPLHTTLENLFRAPINGLAKLLKGFNKLGGRNIAIEAVKKGFHDVLSVIRAVQRGFRDVFPAQTPKGLLNLVKGFSHLMSVLKPSPKTLGEITRIARGIFSVFDIVWQVIKGVASGFGQLFKSVGGGKGDFLGLVANIADLIYNFDQFLKRTGVVQTFFKGLGALLAIPIKLLSTLGKVITGAFSGFDKNATDAIGGSLDRVGKRLGPLQSIFEGFYKGLQKVAGFIQPALQKVGDALTGLGSAIASSISSGDFQPVFDILNTALFGGIILLMHKFLSKGLNIDFGGGLLESIKGTFGELTQTMKLMQTQIKSKILMNIAIAIGILTASVVALSLIDSAKLTKALSAMAVGFGQLLGTMALMAKMDGIVKLPALAAGMIGVATAMAILAGAIALMGNLKTETIAKGIAGISAALVAIGLAMRAMPKGMVLQGAALVLIAGAVNVIGLAIAGLGQLSWTSIAKGLVAIGGALAIIAGAIALMPPTMVLQAAGLVLIAGAIAVIGAAVAGLGQMSWTGIAKSMVALFGALTLIAAALYVMEGALPGAAALIVAAGALAILAPVLIALGQMSWSSILKSLAALAGVFLILGGAALLLTPVLPMILGLGAALLLVGAGMALAGAGAFLFASGFAIFVAAASAGIGAVGALISLIPSFATAFGDGLAAFAVSIVDHQTEMTNALVALLSAMLDGVIKILPKVGRLFNRLIDVAIHTIRSNASRMFDTALFLLDRFLTALDKHLPSIISRGSDLVVKFLQGIGKNEPRVVDAGFKTIIKFINGISKAINNNTDDLRKAGLGLAYAIANGLSGGLLSYGMTKVREAAQAIADALPGWMKKVLHIKSPSKKTFEVGKWSALGVAEGLKAHETHVKRSAEDLANGTLKTLKSTFDKAKSIGLNSEDLTPRIRPVLDLSEIQKGAGQIGGMIGKHGVKANLSVRQANDISSHHRRGQEAGGGDTNIDVKLEQHLHSPKYIGPVESYRGMKSMVAQAKEALG